MWNASPSPSLDSLLKFCLSTTVISGSLWSNSPIPLGLVDGGQEVPSSGLYLAGTVLLTEHTNSQIQPALGSVPPGVKGSLSSERGSVAHALNMPLPSTLGLYMSTPTQAPPPLSAPCHGHPRRQLVV